MIQKKRRINQTVLSKFKWLSSSALHNRYIFTNFSAFSASKLFLVLDHIKSYWKNTLYRCWTSRACT